LRFQQWGCCRQRCQCLQDMSTLHKFNLEYA
jgi:hypothetical protein